MKCNEENEHEVSKEPQEPGQALQEWLQSKANPGVPEEYFNEAIRLGKIKKEIAVLENKDMKSATITERNLYAREIKILFEECDAINAFFKGESSNPSAWNDYLRVDLQCTTARPNDERKRNEPKAPDWFVDKLNSLAKRNRVYLKKTAKEILRILISNHQNQGDRSIFEDIDEERLFFSDSKNEESQKGKSKKQVYNWILAWKRQLSSSPLQNS